MSRDFDLARQTIIDHYENPRNKINKTKALKIKYTKGHNDLPSCIDNIDAYVKIKNKRIVDLKFSGIGCAICTSSTDIMSIILKDKTIKKAKEIIDNYNKMILGKKFNKSTLKKLFFYRNVHKQPNRIKCALVGIQAIENAIKRYEKIKQ